MTGILINFKIIPTVRIADQIASFAKSHKIDLVVMGSHGKTGFDKMILGSVAHRVSQKVYCHVMIIK